MYSYGVFMKTNLDEAIDNAEEQLSKADGWTSNDQTSEMEWSADNINTRENPAFYTYHQRPSKFKEPVRTGMPARASAGSSANDR